MFKAIFGVLGLLIALAIVSSLAKTQLGALGQIGQSTTRVHSPSGNDSSAADSNSGSVAGRAVGGARLDGFGAAAGAEMPSAQQQIQGVQQSARDRTTEALQEGMQRNQRALP